MRRHAVRHDFGQTRANPQCVLRNASEGEQSASATVPRVASSMASRSLVFEPSLFCLSSSVSPSGLSAANRQRYVSGTNFFCIKLTFFVFWHLLRSLSRLLRSSVSQRLISSLQVGSAAGVSAS